jgi:hypothetical protein
MAALQVEPTLGLNVDSGRNAGGVKELTMRRGMGYYRRPYTRRPMMARPVYRPFWGPMWRPWGIRPLWLGGGMLVFMLFGCLFLAALMFLH